MFKLPAAASAAAAAAKQGSKGALAAASASAAQHKHVQLLWIIHGELWRAWKDVKIMQAALRI
jgi:hypothetical protein